MKLQLTPEQEAFRTEVRVFTSQLEPAPRHTDLHQHFRSLVAFQRRLHDAGLAVASWPKSYGGRELGPVATAIVGEELGLARAPEVINFVATDIVGPALLRYATEEQLDRWLPNMAAATDIWCQLFSEPDAGSDLASLRTKAVPTDDGWVVSGQKVWSTWGQFARYGLLLARTGPVESRHKGISAFVLDMDAPGVDIRPLKTMTGEDEFAEVHLDEAPVRRADLIGEVDGGWAVTMHMLAQERGTYAVRRSSVIRGALVELVSLASGLSPAVRDEVVGAVVAMELLDHRIAHVVAQLERGEHAGPDAAITKRLLTIAEQRVFAARHRLLGTAGMAWAPGGDEAGLTEHYLYSRASSIYGGSQEIQRNLIAERLLGLPRD